MARKIGDPHPDHDRLSSLWQKTLDFAAGEECVKANGTEYLPLLEGQRSHTDRAYVLYLDRAWLFPAVEKTVEAMVGLATRKDANFELPDGTDWIAEDILGDGRGLLECAGVLVDQVVNPSRVGVLVDHPTGGGELTEEEAQELGLRPYWAIYTAENILYWEDVRLPGTALRVPTYVELLEHGITEADNRIRALSIATGIYTVQMYRKGASGWEQDGPELTPKMDGQPLDRIPFRFFGAVDNTPTARKPLLLHLCNLARSHYVNTADLEAGLRLTARPTPVVINDQGARANLAASVAARDIGGIDDGSRSADLGGEHSQARIIGGEEVWELSGQDADAKYLEFTGAGLERIEATLARKQEAMAIAGARMLMPERRQVEAAETARIHRAGEHSALARITRNVSQGIEWLLQITLDWAGIAGEYRFAMPTDFWPNPIDPQMLRELLNAWAEKAIDFQDLHQMLVEGELRDPSRSPEEVKASLEEEARERGSDTGADPPEQPTVVTVPVPAGAAAE